VPFWPALTPRAADEQNYTTLNEKDETAVAGLLALGMNEPDLSLSDLVVPSPGTPMIPSNLSHQLPFPSQVIQNPPESSLETLSSTEIQVLLRHYRYEVAPWVSVSTPSRIAKC
jgi:hypothetical protein